MPSSYRERDEREGDRIVYFDYAKSLESKRTPIPWRPILGIFLLWLTSLAVVVAITYAFTGELYKYTFLFAAFAVVASLGLVPLVRANRQLSADNIVEVRRR